MNTMCVCISLSAYVTLFCLFSPKLSIILLHPDKNVRKLTMNSATYKRPFKPVSSFASVDGRNNTTGTAYNGAQTDGGSGPMSTTSNVLNLGESSSSSSSKGTTNPINKQPMRRQQTTTMTSDTADQTGSERQTGSGGGSRLRGQKSIEQQQQWRQCNCLGMSCQCLCTCCGCVNGDCTNWRQWGPTCCWQAFKHWIASCCSIGELGPMMANELELMDAS